MIHDENDVVQLLMDTGVLTQEDVTNIQTLKGEALLQLMIARRVLLPSEIEDARMHVLNMLTKHSRTQRLHAHISLVDLITTNLHRRMGIAGDQVRTTKEKLTSGNFAAIAAKALVVK